MVVVNSTESPKSETSHVWDITGEIRQDRYGVVTVFMFSDWEVNDEIVPFEAEIKKANEKANEKIERKMNTETGMKKKNNSVSQATQTPIPSVLQKQQHNKIVRKVHAYSDLIKIESDPNLAVPDRIRQN